MSTVPKMKPVKRARLQRSQVEPARQAYAHAPSVPQAEGKEQPPAIQTLANLVMRIELQGKPSDLLNIPFAARVELPESCCEIAVIRTAVNGSLIFDFAEHCLSVEERRQMPAYNNEGFFPRSLREKWDRYLLGEAVQRYGARILLSDHVMARVWAWAGGEERGSRKLVKLFAKIHKAARIELKQAKGPITPQLRLSKGAFVAELTELQRRLREKWPALPAEVRQFVAREVEISPPFFQLKKNAPQLAQFLTDDRIALAFRGEPEHITLTATKFFIKWLAVSKNRTEESVRQDLTKR